MYNYKKALYDHINNELFNGFDSDYSADFCADRTATDSAYICDAFAEFADSRTSIYYSDIIKFISDHTDEVNDVNDVIAEYGWDGCGSDLYKAGQMAECLHIEQELYKDITQIIYKLTLDYLDAEEGDADAEKAWAKLDEQKRAELIGDAEYNLDERYIDRLDDIADAVEEYEEAIKKAAEDMDK